MRVHIRDRETGALIRLQHYTAHHMGDEKMYEQPPGSGNMYDVAGRAIGRWESHIQGKNTIWKRISEEHIEAKVAMLNKEEYLESQNDMLRAELAAMRTEENAKAPAVTPVKVEVKK